MDFEKYKVAMNFRCVCGCMDGNRFHKVYRFPNDYGASVVSNPKTAGHVPGGYLILVIRFVSPPPENDYVVGRKTTITDDVVRCRDWVDVENSLNPIFNL
jgi:hypothetical protein